MQLLVTANAIEESIAGQLPLRQVSEIQLIAEQLPSELALSGHIFLKGTSTLKRANSHHMMEDVSTREGMQGWPFCTSATICLGASGHSFKGSKLAQTHTRTHKHTHTHTNIHTRATQRLVLCLPRSSSSDKHNNTQTYTHVPPKDLYCVYQGQVPRTNTHTDIHTRATQRLVLCLPRSSSSYLCHNHPSLV